MGRGLGMFGLCVGSKPDDLDVGTLVGITCMKRSSAVGRGLQNGKERDTHITQGQEHAQMGREARACWVRMLCMHV